MSPAHARTPLSSMLCRDGAETGSFSPPDDAYFVFNFIYLPQTHRFLTRIDPVSMFRAALGRRNRRDLA